MAGRNYLPPGVMLRDYALPPRRIATGPTLERKILAQHSEIQSLLDENQSLAATHVALKQDLAAIRQEAERMMQAIGSLQTDKDQMIRVFREKASKIEAELLGSGPLKAELQRLHPEIQNLQSVRQELMSQVQLLTKEIQRARADALSTQGLKSEIDELHKELERARYAVEYEKKAGTKLFDQSRAMELNVLAMAREREKLEAQIINTERKTLAYDWRI